MGVCQEPPRDFLHTGNDDRPVTVYWDRNRGHPGTVVSLSTSHVPVFYKSVSSDIIKVNYLYISRSHTKHY